MLAARSFRLAPFFLPLFRSFRFQRLYSNMSSSSLDTSSLGYPHRTFRTQILPCESQSHISFAPNPSLTEPLFHAIPRISSAITQQSLETAAQHLQAGHLVAFPTETVYGLGACALQDSSASKIYAAKNRPSDNPLIVHVSDLEMLYTLLPPNYQLSKPYDALIRHFWPGALTLLFPVDLLDPKVPSVVTCGHSSVAIRMPSHPIARALISLSKLPLAAPSANASGRPSPTTAAHVMTDLGGQLDQPLPTTAAHGVTDLGGSLGRLEYILDGGPANVGLESTVVDGISMPGEIRILRPGGITVEQIQNVLSEQGLLLNTHGDDDDDDDDDYDDDKVRLRVYGKDLATSIEQESNPTTPGMKYRHYSPTARVVMLFPSPLLISAMSHNGSTVPLASALPDQTNSTGRLVSDIVRSRLQSAQIRPSASDSVVRVGLMAPHDSTLTKWIQKSAQPLLSLQDPPSDSIHKCLLPPFTLKGLDGVEIHPFDLGPCAQPQIYARRLFDGLRTLDQGPLNVASNQAAVHCDLILVEAINDNGVGLAVMNRLKKAASETVVIDC